jgi:hypothetical protein
LIPGERRAVGQHDGDDLDVGGGPRALGQRPQRASVDPGDALDERKIQEVDQIAELDAVLLPTISLENIPWILALAAGL